MYSEMLRQFRKGSPILISSESSKIHVLIKVLYMSVWFNLCRFLVPYSECVCAISSSATVLVLRSLGMKCFTSKFQICKKKNNVYNFRYKISVGILMKLEILMKQIYYIASSGHITFMPFLVPILVNCK